MLAYLAALAYSPKRNRQKAQKDTIRVLACLASTRLITSALCSRPRMCINKEERLVIYAGKTSGHRTFEKIGTNKLPEAIGTIKLPERQINGSSYTTECDLNQFLAVAGSNY